jgi:hypothetical protein
MTSQPAPRSAYSMGSWPNMLRSLLVIGLMVAGLVAIVPRISQVERPAVDAVSKASYVAKQTGWQVELPAGLGSDWVPTVASLAPGTEEVLTFTTVWTTPSGGDIALKEAAGVTPGWVERSVNGGAAGGEVAIDGRTWQRYAAAERGQVSYVLRGAATGGKALTLVATGVVSDDELKALVAALDPVAPAS